MPTRLPTSPDQASAVMRAGTVQLLFVGRDADQLAHEAKHQAPDAGWPFARTVKEALALVDRVHPHAVVCTLAGDQGRRLFQTLGARHPGILRVLVAEPHGLTLAAAAAAPFAAAFVKRDGVLWLPWLIARMLGIPDADP